MNGNTQGEVRAQNVWLIETNGFTTAWKKMRLSADDLLDLQDAIRADPTSHPVVAGTGGLRKMRFSPVSSGKGKRGSLRVCYAYVPRFAVIVLVLVYPKNVNDSLSPVDKKSVKKWLREFEEQLAMRKDLDG